MNIAFTNHAQIRFLERNISMLHIKQTLMSPDSKKETFGNAMRLRKRFQNKMLEMVVKYQTNKIIIITLYYI